MPSSEPVRHASGPIQETLDAPDEAPVRAFERSGLAPLLRRGARDGQRLALGATRVQATRSDDVCVDSSGALDQARQHPVGVPEQGGVGRPVDVRFHRRRVEPQPVACDLLLATACCASKRLIFFQVFGAARS